MNTGGEAAELNSVPEGEPGVIYTFYSYKGGVGRSMALANVGCLLARWGRRVLLVDFDIEAPGLERFFGPRAVEERKTRPGVVDIVLSHANDSLIDWRDCLIDLTSEYAGAGGTLALLSAGRLDDQYSERVQSLNWTVLFNDEGVGDLFFKMREEWTTREGEPGGGAGFDFVLIDSRTGITDIGGICTALLPDDVILFFTTNVQSYLGVRDVAFRATEARHRVPRDLAKLRFVPVPTRDEGQSEWDKNREWRRVFADAFRTMFADWLPISVSPWDAMNKLYIPYVPVWSFGENLPVHVAPDETLKPGSIGAAFGRLAKLLDSRLDWSKLAVDITSHELEEERQAAREQLRKQQELASRSAQRVKALGLLSVLSCLVATMLGFGLWKTGHGLAERTEVDTIMNHLPNLKVAERLSLVAEELVGKPEPPYWYPTLSELWETAVPAMQFLSPTRMPILGAVVSNDGGWLVWNTQRVLQWESLGGQAARPAEQWDNAAISKVGLVSTGEWAVVQNDAGQIEIVPREPGHPRKSLSAIGEVADWGSALAANVMWLRGRDGEAYLVDPDLELHKLQLPAIEEIALSPNGEYAFASSDRRVTVLDHHASWSPVTILAGELVASGNWGAIVQSPEAGVFMAWLSETKKPVSSEPSPDFSVATFTSDGDAVAWTDDLKAYRIKEEAGIERMTGAPVELQPSATVSRQGLMVRGNGVVNLWTGRDVAPPRAGTAILGTTNGSITPDGRQAVFVDSNGRVTIVSMETPLSTNAVELPQNPSVIAQSETGRWLAAGYWGSSQRGVKLIDTKTKAKAALKLNADVNRVFVSPDGSSMAVGADDGSHILALKEGELVEKYKNDDPVAGVQWAGAQTTFILKGDNGIVERWQPPAKPVALSDARFGAVDVVGSKADRFLGVESGVVKIRWPDEKTESRGGTLKVLAKSPVAPRVLVSRRNDTASVLSVGPRGWETLVGDQPGDWFRASPDLTLVLARTDQGLRVRWTDGEQANASPSVGRVGGAVFSRSGRHLLVRTGAGLRLFDVDPQDHRLTLKTLGELASDMDLTFDDTGEYILSDPRGELRGGRLSCSEVVRQILELINKGSPPEGADESQRRARQLGSKRPREAREWGVQVPSHLLSGMKSCEPWWDEKPCELVSTYLIRHADEPEDFQLGSGILDLVTRDLKTCVSGSDQQAPVNVESTGSEASATDAPRGTLSLLDLRTERILSVARSFGPRQIIAWAGPVFVVRPLPDRLEVYRAKEAQALSYDWNTAVKEIAEETTTCLSIESRLRVLGQNAATAKQRHDVCSRAK